MPRFKILLIVLIFLSVLLTFEVFLGLVRKINYFPIEYDEELMYKTPKNSIFEIEKEGFSIKVKTDRYGFRNSELGYLNNDADFKVLSVGDSFAFGWDVEENETYTSIINSRLRKEGINAGLISASVPGYGTIHESILAKKYAKPLEADLVIINLFIGNDFEDNLNFRKLNVRERLDLYFYRFNTYYWISKSINKLRIFFHGDIPGWISTFRTTFGINNSNSELAWAITNETLTNLSSYLKNENISMFIVLMPSKIQLEKKMQEDYYMQNGARPEDYDFQKANNLIKRWGEDNGIKVIDLTPKMMNKSEEYYSKKGGHWNSAGYMLASDIIYDELKPYLT